MGIDICDVPSGIFCSPPIGCQDDPQHYIGSALRHTFLGRFGHRFLPPTFAAVALCTPVYAVGQCALNNSGQSALAALETMRAKPGYALRKAQVYLDAGCLEDAQQWYLKARDNVGVEDQNRQSRLNGINGALQIIDAIHQYRAGMRADAIAALTRIVQTYRLMDVTPRALFLLGQLLVSDPDPSAWGVVEDGLKGLTQDESWSWQAKLLLTDHEIAVSGATEAIAHLQADLAGELPTGRQLILKVLLAHALERNSRIAEAQIILANIEKDFGLYVLDPDARIFYLKVAVDVWSRRIEIGGDTGAADRLVVLRRAFKEAQAER